jgi:hypothetical protein
MKAPNSLIVIYAINKEMAHSLIISNSEIYAISKNHLSLKQQL